VSFLGHQSPGDLSPIEDIWGIMSDKVYKKTYHTVDQLWEAVVATFFQIPTQVFQICTTE